jgi:hypothetical protein
MKIMRDEENYEGLLDISEGMEDWILDHIYPDLPDDYPQSEASELASKTFRMTFNIPEDDEKNSEKSTPGIQQDEQITA